MTNCRTTLRHRPDKAKVKVKVKAKAKAKVKVKVKAKEVDRAGTHRRVV
jgi:hypothetical protein